MRSMHPVLLKQKRLQVASEGGTVEIQVSQFIRQWVPSCWRSHRKGTTTIRAGRYAPVREPRVTSRRYTVLGSLELVHSSREWLTAFRQRRNCCGRKHDQARVVPLTTGYHLGWMTPSDIMFWLLDRLRVKVNIIICHAAVWHGVCCR